MANGVCHGRVGCDLSFVMYWMTSTSKLGRVRALALCQVRRHVRLCDPFPHDCHQRRSQFYQFLRGSKECTLYKASTELNVETRYVDLGPVHTSNKLPVAYKIRFFRLVASTNCRCGWWRWMSGTRCLTRLWWRRASWTTCDVPRRPGWSCAGAVQSRAASTFQCRSRQTASRSSVARPSTRPTVAAVTYDRQRPPSCRERNFRQLN